MRYLTAVKLLPVPAEVLNDWIEHNGADGRLLYALELLWIHNVDKWRSRYGQPLAERRTKIVWGSLPENVGGQYSRAANRITISESYRSEPLSVLAATLAHEVYHAVSGRASLDAADCLEEEMTAFAWGTATWKPFRPSLKWSRSHDITTDGELWQEEIYEAWGDRKLREAVLNSEGYQQQCLARVLPAS